MSEMYTAAISLPEIRREYLQLTQELSDRSNNASRARVEAILSSTICERLSSYMISNDKRHLEGPRFDPYYSEKHEMTKRKFVDRMKTRLSELGKEAQFLVQTEEPSDFGRSDLVIINGNQLKISAMGGRAVRVELKASRGLDLSQIERYLLNAETLLLVRVMTGHVARLSPNKLSAFLEESLRDLSRKAKRLIDGRQFLIPGQECHKCPIKECNHNKSRQSKQSIFVTINHKEFERDLEEFMLNLYPTIDKAIHAVFEELGIPDKNSSNQEVTPPSQVS